MFWGFASSLVFGSICLVVGVFLMEACLWSSVKQAGKGRQQGAKYK